MCQGLVPLWHTTELPGHIVVNAETGDDESPWHREGGGGSCGPNPLCLQMGPPQLMQVDHRLPRQENRRRQAASAKSAQPNNISLRE